MRGQEHLIWNAPTKYEINVMSSLAGNVRKPQTKTDGRMDGQGQLYMQKTTGDPSKGSHRWIDKVTRVYIVYPLPHPHNFVGQE